MTLSDKKLYCGDRNKGQIIDTVNLYTDLKDVQNQGKVFNYNGETLYAKWGEMNDDKSSKIRYRVNGLEKALARSAIVTITKEFSYYKNDFPNIARYKANLNATDKKIHSLYEEETAGWIGINTKQDIPPNASNIRISINNITSAQNVRVAINTIEVFLAGYDNKEVTDTRSILYSGNPSGTLTVKVDNLANIDSIKFVTFRSNTNFYTGELIYDSITITYDLLESVTYIDNFADKRQFRIKDLWVDDRGRIDSVNKQYIFEPWYSSSNSTSNASKLTYYLDRLPIPSNAKDIKFSFNIISYETWGKLTVLVEDKKGINSVFSTTSYKGVKVFDLDRSVKSIEILTTEYKSHVNYSYSAKIVISDVRLTYSISN